MMFLGSCSPCCSGGGSQCYPPLQAHVRLQVDWYGASTALGSLFGHIGNNPQNRLRGRCFFAVPPYYGTGTSDRFRDNPFFMAMSDVTLSMPPPAAWPSPPPSAFGWTLTYGITDNTPHGFTDDCDQSLYGPWLAANGLLSRNGLTPIGSSSTIQLLDVHLIPFTYPGLPQPETLMASGVFDAALFQQQGVAVCGLAWCRYQWTQGVTFSNGESDAWIMLGESRGASIPRFGVNPPVWPSGPFRFDAETQQATQVDVTQYVLWGVTNTQTLWTSGAFELEYTTNSGLDAAPWMQRIGRLGGTVSLL